MRKINFIFLILLYQVLNPALFQLLTILTLLDTEGLPSTDGFAEIVRIRQVYLKLFQRKLKAVGGSFIDYSHFRSILHKIKTFSLLISKFME